MSDGIPSERTTDRCVLLKPGTAASNEKEWIFVSPPLPFTSSERQPTVVLSVSFGLPASGRILMVLTVYSSSGGSRSASQILRSRLIETPVLDCRRSYADTGSYEASFSMLKSPPVPATDVGRTPCWETKKKTRRLLPFHLLPSPNSVHAQKGHSHGSQGTRGPLRVLL